MPAGLSRLRQRRQGVLGELLAALQSGPGGRDDELLVRHSPFLSEIRKYARLPTPTARATPSASGSTRPNHILLTGHCEHRRGPCVSSFTNIRSRRRHCRQVSALRLTPTAQGSGSCGERVPHPRDGGGCRVVAHQSSRAVASGAGCCERMVRAVRTGPLGRGASQTAGTPLAKGWRLART